jgi:integrase
LGLYIRSGHYYFKKQIQGKTYYQALKLKRGQEALLSPRVQQVEEEIIAKHFGLPYQPKKEISFLDYSRQYLKAKKFKKSWDRDKQRLCSMAECLGDPLLSEIEKPDIEKLEAHLFSQKLRPSTVNRYFELLRHFLNLAIEDGYLKENPARFYQPFVEDGSRRALSKEDLSKILQASSQIQAHPRTYIQAIIYDLIVFALATGMRLSEILRLKRSYIIGDMISYPISETKGRRRTFSRSSQKYRLIILSKSALEIVSKYHSSSDYIFPIHRRDPNVVCHVINRIRRLTGIKDFTFHQLRHTASTIISASSSLAAAKIVLGHADLKTTLQYTHPGIDEQRQAVAKLGNFIADLLCK